MPFRDGFIPFLKISEMRDIYSHSQIAVCDYLLVLILITNLSLLMIAKVVLGV